MPPDIAKGDRKRHIEIELRDISQLFNTMDPSPFYEKDLDEDAEEFIVSWAQEFPIHEPLCLTIHLSSTDKPQQPDEAIAEAVRHYFSYRANLSRRDFGRLMREGRLTLVIGLVFLSACLTAGQILFHHAPEPVNEIMREGLTIAGWVAMWRPLQLYLYDWWPLRRRWKIYQKLGAMKVEILRQRVNP